MPAGQPAPNIINSLSSHYNPSLHYNTHRDFCPISFYGFSWNTDRQTNKEGKNIVLSPPVRLEINWISCTPPRPTDMGPQPASRKMFFHFLWGKVRGKLGNASFLKSFSFASKVQIKWLYWKIINNMKLSVDFYLQESDQVTMQWRSIHILEHSENLICIIYNMAVCLQEGEGQRNHNPFPMIQPAA